MPGIKLSSLGDAYFGEHGKKISNEIIAECKDSDLVIFNLESSLFKSEDFRKDKTSLLYSPKESVNVFSGFQNTVANLGNNHTTDYGPEALTKTRSYLVSKGFQVVGAGKDFVEALEPVILTVQGKKIALFSATTDTDEVKSKIAIQSFGCPSYKHHLSQIIDRRKRIEGLDYSIILLHWGNEFSHIISPEQRYYGRKFIDSGFDLVIGSHTHVVQGIEQYKNGLIAYSQGNFIFPSFNKSNSIWKGFFPSFSSISYILNYNFSSKRMEAKPLLSRDGIVRKANINNFEKYILQLSDYQLSPRKYNSYVEKQTRRFRKFTLQKNLDYLILLSQNVNIFDRLKINYTNNDDSYPLFLRIIFQRLKLILYEIGFYK